MQDKIIMQSHIGNNYESFYFLKQYKNIVNIVNISKI